MKLLPLCLVVLLVGCTDSPRCTSADYKHCYGKWEHVQSSSWHTVDYHKRVCETCGWNQIKTR